MGFRLSRGTLHTGNTGAQNCMKVDLLFLDCFNVVRFSIILSCFCQETSGVVCFTKKTETRDLRLVGSIEELAVSVR